MTKRHASIAAAALLAAVVALVAVAVFMMRWTPDGDGDEIPPDILAIAQARGEIDAQTMSEREHQRPSVRSMWRRARSDGRRAAEKGNRAAEPKDGEAAAVAAAIGLPATPLSAADQELVDKIETALDAERFEDLIAIAPKASAASPAVRLSLVGALGWFGRRALPELTPLLGDDDEDVRDSALNEWTQALDEIEGEPERLSVAERAMKALSDENALDGVASAYLGLDDEAKAVASLLRVIESQCSKAARDKAIETYSFLTGDEFTGRTAAEDWIRQYNEEQQPTQEERND